MTVFGISSKQCGQDIVLTAERTQVRTCLVCCIMCVVIRRYLVRVTSVVR